MNVVKNLLNMIKSVIVMNANIIGVIVAVVCGFFIAFLNYILSKIILTKAPEKYSLITVVRQVFQIGFLVAVYFVGDKIQSVNTIYLLVGAVVGMTAPMIYFTRKLLMLNRTANKKEPEKEGDANG